MAPPPTVRVVLPATATIVRPARPPAAIVPIAVRDPETGVRLAAARAASARVGMALRPLTAHGVVARRSVIGRGATATGRGSVTVRQAMSEPAVQDRAARLRRDAMATGRGRGTVRRPESARPGMLRGPGSATGRRPATGRGGTPRARGRVPDPGRRTALPPRVPRAVIGVEIGRGSGTALRLVGVRRATVTVRGSAMVLRLVGVRRATVTARAARGAREEPGTVLAGTASGLVATESGHPAPPVRGRRAFAFAAPTPRARRATMIRRSPRRSPVASSTRAPGSS